MNTTDWPTKEEQAAWWRKKEDEFAVYLNELHARQSDPQYIASYKEWLNNNEQQQLNMETK